MSNAKSLHLKAILLFDWHLCHYRYLLGKHHYCLVIQDLSLQDSGYNNYFL